MRRIVQSVDTPAEGDSHEPIIIHGASETIPGQLVLFVHGLNGHRYKTWGRFPHLFMNDGQHDIGLHGYASGFGRLMNLSVTFDKQAEELAHQLRDCTYSQIALIGHSMGGLLCMAAIRNLIDGNSSSAIRRIAGLVLIGTPQAGSTSVPFWARWLSPDLRLLTAHSAALTDIQRRFIDHVVVSMFDQTHGSRFIIPTFAVVGTNDRWVTDLSATLRIPYDQIRRVFGSHIEIAKPVDAQSTAFEFAHDRVAACFTFHRELGQTRENIQRRLSTFITENFRGVEQQVASSIVGVDPNER